MRSVPRALARPVSLWVVPRAGFRPGWTVRCNSPRWADPHPARPAPPGRQTAPLPPCRQWRWRAAAMRSPATMPIRSLPAWVAAERASGRFLEPVPEAANRDQMARFVGLLFDLLPQTAHVHVHGPRRDIPLLAPQRFQELIAAIGAAYGF